MGKITIASARQRKWLGVECDACGTRYACLVEAEGTASDTFLPWSKDSLKDMAQFNLDFKLRQKAELMPCPCCGSYQQGRVEHVFAVAKGLIVWGLTAALFLLQVLLIVVAAPKTPAWVLLIVLAVALILPRLFCNPLVAKFDPNLDLEKNLRLAQARMAQGVLRIEPEEEDPAAAPPLLITPEQR